MFCSLQSSKRVSLSNCRHLNAHDVSAPVQQELQQLAAALNAGDGSAAKRIQVRRQSVIQHLLFGKSS